MLFETLFFTNIINPEVLKHHLKIFKSNSSHSKEQNIKELNEKIVLPTIVVVFNSFDIDKSNDSSDEDQELQTQ